MAHKQVGVLTHIGPTTEVGQNQKKKATFVISWSEGSYTAHAAYDVWGDRIEELQSFPIGSTLEVEFKAESREYNGRWYTNLTAWHCHMVQNVSSDAAESQRMQQNVTEFMQKLDLKPVQPQQTQQQPAGDGLPF